MFAALLAAHSLLNRMYPGAALPAAPPAPAWTPRPIVSQPIAFAVTALPSLFGIVGSAIGSTTLATVTCADAAMTISLSETVPGLTFAYAANVLTVSGTPTTPTGVHRVNVSYVASDGSGAARGASSHTITIVSASEVLSIGSMAAVVGRVGAPQSSTIASPTTNYAVDVTAVASAMAPGLSVSLAWTKASSTGSGTLTIAGTPTAAGTYSITVDYYAYGGVWLGTSTHATTIVESWQTVPGLPAPSSPPSPPSPTSPPAPDPVPQPGSGPDPFLASVKVLMRFDAATGIERDEKGHQFTNHGATSAAGAVGEAAQFAGASTFIASAAGAFNLIAGIDGSDGNIAVECMVYIGQTTWDALLAPGKDERFCPVVTCISASGDIVWALGLIGFPQARALGVDRCLGSLFWSPIVGNTTGTGAAFIRLAPVQWFTTSFGTTPARPERFMYLAGGREDSVQASWLDGRPSLTADGTQQRYLKVSAASTLQIGGPCPLIPFLYQSTIVNVVPLYGAVDELRVTAANRLGTWIATPPTTIPDPYRVIPWPNY
jgi:hypothetical protein